MHPFRLSIGLWVVCSGHAQLGAQQLEEMLVELRCEARVTITDNGTAEAVVSEHLVDVYLGCLLRIHILCRWGQVYLLCQSVHEGHDRVVSPRERQARDEV